MHTISMTNSNIKTVSSPTGKSQTRIHPPVMKTAKQPWAKIWSSCHWLHKIEPYFGYWNVISGNNNRNCGIHKHILSKTVNITQKFILVYFGADLVTRQLTIVLAASAAGTIKCCIFDLASANL